MSDGTPKGACWPDRQDAQLLRACLLPDGRGAEAYRRWRASVDLKTMRHPWLRLMPLLQHNLGRLGIADAEQDLLRGVLRQSWFTGQVATARAAPILQRMDANGIPTMVLKGAALAELYYENPALRPMEDLDVCVPVARAPEAFALMQSAGYRPGDYGFEPTFPTCQLRSHAWGFRAENDHELDLHWHVLPAARWDDADRGFWADSRPFELGSVATRTLSAEDHVLHACVHGTTWNQGHILHWIADVATIVRRVGDRFDPRVLIDRARQLGVVSHLKAGLSYVHGLLDVLPQHVVAALRRVRPQLSDRVSFFYRRNERSSSAGAMALQLLFWHRERHARAKDRWLSFPAYLREYWRCDSNWSMARRALRAMSGKSA